MIFFIIYKMSEETTYYQINRGTIVNRAKKYYEDNKKNIKRKSNK